MNTPPQKVRRRTEWSPDRIRRLRCGLYLSQERFAATIGVTFGTVNRWERGHTTPSLIIERIFTQLEQKLNREIAQTTHS